MEKLLLFFTLGVVCLGVSHADSGASEPACGEIVAAYLDLLKHVESQLKQFSEFNCSKAESNHSHLHHHSEEEPDDPVIIVPSRDHEQSPPQPPPANHEAETTTQSSVDPLQTTASSHQDPQRTTSASHDHVETTTSVSHGHVETTTSASHGHVETTQSSHQDPKTTTATSQPQQTTSNPYAVLPVILNETICEGDTTTLTCNSRTINITQAEYGRQDPAVCHHSNWPYKDDKGNINAVYNRNDCRSELGQATTYASSQCNGKQSCVLSASNGNHGDPCGGVYKYATVQYFCNSDH